MDSLRSETAPHDLTPKQSFRPSPSGVNAFGSSKPGPGPGVTVTMMLSVDSHSCFEMARTIYIVEDVGEATGFLMVAKLKLAEGVHIYRSPPLALSVAVPSIQFTSFDFETVTTGLGFTVSLTTLIRLSHPFVVLTVSKYHPGFAAVCPHGS